MAKINSCEVEVLSYDGFIEVVVSGTLDMRAARVAATDANRTCRHLIQIAGRVAFLRLKPTGCGSRWYDGGMSKPGQSAETRD